MEGAEKQKTTAVKSTQTAKKVRELVKRLYSRAHEAKAKGQPVAYCMVSSHYNEILIAMGIVPVWTENYAGLCAAKKAAEPLLVKAEAEGYSNVICGYARTGIGFDALRRELGEIPPGSPDGGMADPDLLLGSSATCDPRFKWYQALGRYKDTPIYNFDVVIPPVDVDLREVRDYYIRYQREQFQGLVDFLEKTLGKKMDYDKLSEAIAIADKTIRVWCDAQDLRRASPCPMPTEDHFNTFAPGRFMLGEPEALDFYQSLYDELKYRVDHKMGVITNEKYRLLWGGGLPPWHNLRLLNYFEDFGAVFVIETTYRPLDLVEVPSSVTHPLDYLAWRTFLTLTYRHERARRGCGHYHIQLLLDLIEDYKVDGMVMHGTVSCRAQTVGQLYFGNLVQEYVRVPSISLESDIVDARTYSEAQTRMQIEAFIETVDSYQRGRSKKEIPA